MSQICCTDKQELRSSQVLEKFAYQVVAQQFKHFSKQEKEVLRDEDPEPLHQMRVGTRRLRTALQIFDQVVELPHGASGKQLRVHKRDEALSTWEETRLNYLHDDYRRHLHQMLLQPPIN